MVSWDVALALTPLFSTRQRRKDVAPVQVVDRVKQRPLYVVLGVLMMLIAAAGFVPESARMVLHHTVPRYPIVHIHAVIFGGWLLLFITQAVLAASGQIAWHRRLGNFLFAYALLMFVAGVLVTIDRFVHEVQAGDIVTARTTNLSPVIDMLAFPAFFCAAWFYRRKPEVHKRLMVVTATMLLYAAIVRIGPINFRHSIMLVMAVWSFPIVIAVAHDLGFARTLHRTYVVGILAVVVLSMRPLLENSTPWKGATNWLAQEVVRHS